MNKTSPKKSLAPISINGSCSQYVRPLFAHACEFSRGDMTGRKHGGRTNEHRYCALVSFRQMVADYVLVQSGLWLANSRIGKEKGCSRHPKITSSFAQASVSVCVQAPWIWPAPNVSHHTREQPSGSRRSNPIWPGILPVSFHARCQCDA